MATEILLDNLNCIICKDTYTDPRFLACHHSFCLKCLKDLCSKSEDTTIQCPECEKPSALENVDDLPKDTRLMSFIEMFQSLIIGDHENLLEAACGASSFTETLICMGGISNTDTNGTECMYLDPEAKSWKSLTELPHKMNKLTFMGIALVPGGLLVTGGLAEEANEEKKVVVQHECWCYIFKEKKWEQWQSLSQDRFLHSTVLNGDTVYCMGGMIDRDSLKFFSTLYNRNVQLPKTEGASADAVDDEGGDAEKKGKNAPVNLTSAVECCKVSEAGEGKWITSTPMKKPTVFPTVISWKDCIYVFGGIVANDGSNPNPIEGGDSKEADKDKTDDVYLLNQVFNSTTASWDLKSPIPFEFFGQASPVNDKFYFTGIDGNDSSASLCYDPELDTWTVLPPPKIPHMMSPSVTWQGSVLVCGGLFHDFIERYDPETEKWSLWGFTLMEPMFLHNVLAVDMESVSL